MSTKVRHRFTRYAAYCSTCFIEVREPLPEPGKNKGKRPMLPTHHESFGSGLRPLEYTPDAEIRSLTKALEDIVVVPTIPLPRPEGIETQGPGDVLRLNNDIIHSHQYLLDAAKNVGNIGTRASDQFSALVANMQTGRHKQESELKAEILRVKEHCSSMIERGTEGKDALNKVYQTYTDSFDRMIRDGEEGLAKLEDMNARLTKYYEDAHKDSQHLESSMQEIAKLLGVFAAKADALSNIGKDLSKSMDTILERQGTYARDRQE